LEEQVYQGEHFYHQHFHPPAAQKAEEKRQINKRKKPENKA
jgi:hypothetical protein